MDKTVKKLKMNKDMIIIYGSCYGTTKKYAEELSGRFGCEQYHMKMWKILMHIKQLSIWVAYMPVEFRGWKRPWKS